MVIRFGNATTTGGTPPVQIVCQPSSDSSFKIGTTSVTCTATDLKSVTDSCPFTVTVIAPPRLSATKFIAFGDSMTAGEIVSESSTTLFRVLRLDTAKSYPSDLVTSLNARYTAQTNDIIVSNSGKPGEKAVDGVARLSGALGTGSFQALLLMEGVNDFPNTSSALTAMREMVRNATGRGLRVFLATLPPENPFSTCQPNHGGNWAFVVPYNDGLRSIAASQNAVLVDVYSEFNGDTTTLIDCDGLHPTAAGYQRIADTFFKAIQQAFELPVTAIPASMPVPFGAAPRRR
jgi:lysophospholipase L1-like esterase